MKDTRLTMGMPASVSIEDANTREGIDTVFAYLDYVDHRFSPYRSDSEVTVLNKNPSHLPSPELAEILSLANATRAESDGFFDIRRPDGILDPSGIVKGWAISNAAELLKEQGYENFCIEVGGDMMCVGKNADGEEWLVGVRNPFNRHEIVKILMLTDHGIATSGSAARGDHIYNPLDPTTPIHDIASITVIAPDVLTADRYATAAFAMGKDGIRFIEVIPDCEAYQIGQDGIATMTSGFKQFAT